MDFEYDIIEDDNEEDAMDLIFNGIPRNVFERSDYFHSFDELSFFKRFRLTKESVLFVLGLIDHELEYPSDLNNSVSPMNQLLVTLRFFATGTHLLAIADFAGMHYSTVSRIIVRVSEAIARLYNGYIKMPVTQAEVTTIQNDFYAIAAFPRVIGTIDCTHIKIQSPGGNDPEVFRNRKHYFSFNVQAVCSPNLKVMNLVARWPGSVHDSTIFNNSNVKAEFENGRYGTSFLLGDSGYPIKNYLLTPFLNPATEGEQTYNESHIRTRNTVERLFGVLKRRFPVLAYGCRLKLDTVMTIIVATSILHNIAIDHKEAVPPIPENINEIEWNDLIQNGQMPIVHNQNNYNLRLTGAHVRNNLVRNFFT